VRHARIAGIGCYPTGASPAAGVCARMGRVLAAARQQRRQAAHARQAHGRERVPEEGPQARHQVREAAPRRRRAGRLQLRQELHRAACAPPAWRVNAPAWRPRRGDAEALGVARDRTVLCPGLGSRDVRHDRCTCRLLVRSSSGAPVLSALGSDATQRAACTRAAACAVLLIVGMGVWQS